MRNAKWIYRFPAAALLLAVILTGCAEKGPILLNVGYQAPAEITAASLRTTVGVSTLKDVRGKEASVLGKRTIPNALENDFVVQGTVSGVATASLEKALIARGFSVKDVPSWDLTAEGMKSNGVELLLGGEIKTLWLETMSDTLKTHMQATVQFRVVAGDPSERKIIRSVEVSSRLDQDLLYSREELEDALSEALTSAIDQIFKDEELKKRLQ